MSDAIIRPRTLDDDRQIVSLLNRLFPEFPAESLEGFRFFVENIGRNRLLQHWVADEDGTIVGVASLHQLRTDTPDAVFLEVAVDRDREGKGIGSRLYAEVERHALQTGARRLYGHVLEDRQRGQSFAAKLDFTPTGKGERLSRLDVNAANLSGFDDVGTRLHDAGIRIMTLAEIGMEDETFLRQLYELDRDTHEDIPASESWGFPPLDEWRSVYVLGLGRSPDWCWVALDGTRPVGLARLSLRPPEAAWNAYTGVHRDYRGRGIARALKYRTIEWSRRNGVRFQYTGNEAENERMLAINIRLGYHMLPRDVEVRKEVEQSASSDLPHSER
jgi:GNAT superfamily N-acetyltransferase